MSSIAEGLMAAVLARLEGSPAVCGNVRRIRRIPVTREDAPAVYLIDGADEPSGREKSNCRRQRTKEFTVAVIVRDDDVPAAIDPLVVAVNERLNPEHAGMTPYPAGAVLEQGRIDYASESADADAGDAEMHFRFTYQASGWPLE